MLLRGVSTPGHTGRGRDLSAASNRVAMTQMTMGGAGVNEANGVLSEATAAATEIYP